jgi:hypothetical protein
MADRPGLLAAFMHIPAALEEEFNEWYNTEHVPQRMEVPGFLNATRFKGVDADASYLCVYDLESVDVLKTRSYLHIVGEGRTAWTRRLHHNFFSPITRRVYQRSESDYRALPRGVARGLWLETFDVPEASEENYLGWFRGSYLSALKSVPGVVRVREFINHQNGPKYLYLADTTSVDVFTRVEFLDLQAAATPRRVAVGLDGCSLNTYRKIHEHPRSHQPGERRVDWEGSPRVAAPAV